MKLTVKEGFFISLQWCVVIRARDGEVICTVGFQSESSIVGAVAVDRGVVLVTVQITFTAGFEYTLLCIQRVLNEQ